MKEYKKGTCESCGLFNWIAAKGLCRACYSRLRKTGSLEKRVRVRSKCLVADCDREVVSHGYCDLHWYRFEKYGDPMLTSRPADWGSREPHPLYQSWCWARERSGIGCVPEWLDFWKFVADVGVRPSEKHRLKRIDETKPFGPGNVIWQEHLISGKAGAAYAREHRKRNPTYWQDAELLRNFGITLENYNQRLKEQDGKCAICRKEESVFDKKCNRLRKLAVDHCHNSKAIRGLLCTRCNQGLGSFLDDPALLQAAIEYLKQH